jgi:hypothetical protein
VKELPDFERVWEYENGFYLTCDITRISKILAHYELFKMALDVPGAIVECGVFKGASLARFAMFRDLFGNPYSKKIIGFDTFAEFPDTDYEDDKRYRERFVREAGGAGISKSQLEHVLRHKVCERNVELIEGDICDTVPEYLKMNPHLKISLLNLDTDIYEPAVVVLENLYPRVVRGGVVVLDDYGTFPGETKAIDDYFSDKSVKIRKLPFCMTPCYIKREE